MIIPTGLPEVDAVLQGVPPGEHWAIIGEGNTGRSTVALGILAQALRQNIPVLLCSTDRTPYTVARLDAIMGRLLYFDQPLRMLPQLPSDNDLAEALAAGVRLVVLDGFGGRELAPVRAWAASVGVALVATYIQAASWPASPVVMGARPDVVLATERVGNNVAVRCVAARSIRRDLLPTAFMRLDGGRLVPAALRE